MFPTFANMTSGNVTVYLERLWWEDGLLPGVSEAAPSTPMPGKSSNNSGALKYSHISVYSIYRTTYN